MSEDLFCYSMIGVLIVCALAVAILPAFAIMGVI